jgi:hypothetical protein
LNLACVVASSEYCAVVLCVFASFAVFLFQSCRTSLSAVSSTDVFAETYH